jgi:hypothetical protein
MVTFRVEANGFRVADALIASGRLSPDQTRRQSLVERELAKVVQDRFDRWLADRP